MAKRVLVCGGRNFNLRRGVYERLDELLEEEEIEYVITGGANGADKLAGDWARERAITLIQVFPDWETHGKKAGPLRNSQMLRRWKPDICIAFSGGRGTADMVRKAKKANVETKEYELS